MPKKKKALKAINLDIDTKRTGADLYKFLKTNIATLQKDPELFANFTEILLGKTITFYAIGYDSKKRGFDIHNAKHSFDTLFSFNPPRIIKDQKLDRICV